MIIGRRSTGYLFPPDYCAAFRASLPASHSVNLLPDQLHPAKTWRDVATDATYGGSFMHLECVQELAYRPMRRESGSTGEQLWRRHRL